VCQCVPVACSVFEPAAGNCRRACRVSSTRGVGGGDTSDENDDEAMRSPGGNKCAS